MSPIIMILHCLVQISFTNMYRYSVSTLFAFHLVQVFQCLISYKVLLRFPYDSSSYYFVKVTWNLCKTTGELLENISCNTTNCKKGTFWLVSSSLKGHIFSMPGWTTDADRMWIILFTFKKKKIQNLHKWTDNCLKPNPIFYLAYWKSL